MNDTNQNFNTQSENTEVGIGYLLKVNQMKIRENGIEYFFHPLGKTVVVAPLLNIKNRDLTFSLSYIRASQSSILLPTNTLAPATYRSRLKNDEIELKEIYNVGDYFAEVILILN